MSSSSSSSGSSPSPPAGSFSSPPKITIDDIRRCLATFNDFLKMNFFDETKFKDYQNIDITDSSFDRKDSTFNILNDAIYNDFFDEIKKVKINVDNFKSQYISSFNLNPLKFA